MLLPQLHLLKAKLAYGSREKGNITPDFRTFMDKLLDSGMRSAEDFKAMMLYVEAVLAYFYAHETEEKSRRKVQRSHSPRRY
jgi:CRISPR-associated protein Csm2